MQVCVHACVCTCVFNEYIHYSCEANTILWTLLLIKHDASQWPKKSCRKILQSIMINSNNWWRRDTLEWVTAVCSL